MDQDIEQEGLRRLQHIEEEVGKIESRTPGNLRHSFIAGIMSGAGAVVGGVAALTLAGWVLSLLGIIPGFGYIAHYLQDIMANLHR